MTDVLTVPTHFGDLSDLSTGLIDRVEDGRLILYGPDKFDQGAHVGFRVLLSDESTALEGYGLVTEVYDGGEEREPEIRYDTVLESLELDGRNEVVFERIVLARQSLADDAPATGEVDISELEEQVADVDVEAVSFASEAPPEPNFDEPTDSPPDAADNVATVDFEAPEFDAAVDVEAPADFETPEFETPEFETPEFETPEFETPEFETPEFEDVGDEAYESLAPAAPVDVSPPRVALGAIDGALVRPVFAASWWPRAEAPEPRPATGWFQYAAGSLPVPAQAPRPELSPELRVTPAPRPGAEAAPASMGAAAAAVEVAPEDDAMSDAGELGEDDIDIADDSSDEEASLSPPDLDFEEMPLPDDDAEIAPAVEAEYVSVGDASPDAGELEESFADLDLDEAPVDFDAADEAVDVELDL